MESGHNDDDDERHEEAFGEHIGLSSGCRDEINQIKENDPDLTTLSLQCVDAEQFTDLAWELLGGYVANNASR